MTSKKDIYTLNLPWDELPLRLLEDEQKLGFRQQAQLSHHTTGEVLWSSHTPGSSPSAAFVYPCVSGRHLPGCNGHHYLGSRKQS